MPTRAARRSPAKPTPAPDERPFEGFPPDGRALLKTLARKQDRAWFATKKAEYVELLDGPMHALMHALAVRVAPDFPAAVQAPWKVFRIYRDTRFSPDKRPFKDYVAGSLPLGEGEERPGLYVHLDVKEDFVAAGRWMMSPPVLSAFRQGVADEERGEPFAKAVKALVRKGFKYEGQGQLKRVPSPWPADHPRGELLRLKGFALVFPTPPRRTVERAAYADWIRERLHQAAPVLRLCEELVAGAGA